MVGVRRAKRHESTESTEEAPRAQRTATARAFGKAFAVAVLCALCGRSLCSLCYHAVGGWYLQPTPRLKPRPENSRVVSAARRQQPLRVCLQRRTLEALG